MGYVKNILKILVVRTERKKQQGSLCMNEGKNIKLILGK
jgi:hypothetical protein